MKKKMKCMLAFIAFCQQFAAFAFAQNVNEALEDLMPMQKQGTQQSSLKARTRVFDSILLHHLPDWTPKEIQLNPAKASHLRRSLDGNIMRLSFVPKAESFKDWSNQSGVFGRTEFLGDNVVQAREIARFYNANCRPSNTNLLPLRGNSKKAVLVVGCGSYSKRPESGEVGIYVFLQRNKTAVRLYRQWRTPAFRSEDPRQWPISIKTIDRTVNGLTQARLVGAQ